MSRYLSTKGRAVLSVGVCDRCHMKYALEDLHEDRNAPGLMVCDKDNDLLDPYRLAPRKTEDITVRRPRPDESLS